MREKLHPALEELVSWGHLASWVVVKGQSRSYKVVLYQVSTTQQEKQGRGELKQRKEQPSHTSMDTVRPKDPVVKEQPHISSAGAEIARGGISPNCSSVWPPTDFPKTMPRASGPRNPLQRSLRTSSNSPRLRSSGRGLGTIQGKYADPAASLKIASRAIGPSLSTLSPVGNGRKRERKSASATSCYCA